MIEIQRIHHVSLAVTDIEKAKSFYQDILCLEEIERPQFGFPGAWYQIGNQQLHLIVHPEAKTLRQTNELSSKEGHFAFRVKSYKETLRWLKEKGVEIYENPTSKSGFAQIFVADPDGNLIELNTEQ
ncbi:VOC family protein [Guptibacillus hwajinpoensis]|uniref:VOC family protein n=1 Tax=Guptibacillus hwajinpoensis TaxID=208199 RepID=UPI001CFF1FAA|nr:VOC family protein [Pseudalkalibacillus hwajinpoensis]